MRLALIDGLNLVRRVFAGVPEAFDEDAHVEQAVDAVGRSVGRVLERLQPTHALGVFDSPPPTWRHELHPPYKADRPSMPAPLAENMARMEGAFEEHGVPVHRVAGFEADDVIASIANGVQRIADARDGAPRPGVVIVSTDRALLALLSDVVEVRHHFDDRMLDRAHVVEKFGVAPALLPDWFALVGDSSQGIPGVPGIGARTATTLVAEHGDIETLLSRAGQIGGRAGKALTTHADAARLSLRLTALRLDVPVGANLRDWRLGDR